jgi:hypothetical protein
MKKCYALSLLLPLFFACRSTTPHYVSGLQILYKYDSTRTFDTTAPGTPRYYRPVKIDLFYPATAAKGQALSFGDLLDQYEKRMNFDLPLDSCKKSSRALAGMFAEYFKIDSLNKMLAYPTGITYNPAPAHEKFPLIIYAAGMNGSAWENALLYEQLTQQGFVVAVISSVGKFPGYMSEATDIEEQVKDILFARKFLGDSLSFVDATNTGLLSWSLGGTSIVKAAMLAPDIKCLLSFDGTETHYYGFDTAWDKQYDQILQLPPYAPEKVTMPYMYLSSGRSNEFDSVYVFSQHIPAQEKYFLRFANGAHEDFSILAPIAKKLQPATQNVHVENYDTVCRLASIFFQQYLKHNEVVTTAAYIKQLTGKDSSQFSTRYPTLAP